MAMRAVMAAWEHAEGCAPQERAFDLDVGGTQPHCSGRRRRRVVPDYDARSDPHLQRYFATMKRRQPGTLERAAESPRGRPSPSTAAAAQVAAFGVPVSVEHVLALKALFHQFAKETMQPACRGDLHCIATAQGVVMEHIRLIPASSVDVAAVMRFAASVTNHHRRLRHLLPNPTVPTAPQVAMWLDLLECTDTVDWPSFLLVACTDLAADFAAVKALHSAHDAYLRSTPVRTEEDYQAFVRHLKQHLAAIGHPPGHISAGDTGPRGCFYQPGDFFRARHTCVFADNVFTTLPHRVQFYLHNANARGMTLSSNFCGHGSVQATYSPRAPPSAPGSARQRPATAPRPPAQPNPRRGVLERQTQQFRHTNRVWL